MPWLLAGPTYLSVCDEAPAVARSSPTTMEETNLLFIMLLLLLFVCCSWLLLWQFFCLSGALLHCRSYRSLIVELAGCVDGSFVSNEGRSPPARGGA